MFRDRTNLFVSYRRTYPRSFHTTSKGGLDKGYGEEEGIPMLDVVDFENDDIYGDSGVNNSLTMITENILKPIDTKLATIDDLMGNELMKLYKKVMLPGFQDKTEDINKIESLNFQIIKYLQICSNSIQLIKYNTTTAASSQAGQLRSVGITIILENLGKSYARKIQSRSNKFRKLQNNYLKFLNKDDFKPLPSSSKNSAADNTMDLLLLEEDEEVVADGTLDAAEYSQSVLNQQRSVQAQKSQQRKSEYLKKRDEEITELAKGVLEVSTIFKELQDLIIDQGSVIDRIDYNIELTSTSVQQAQRELNTATRYQKRESKCKIILFLTLLCMFLFFVFMLKPRSGSTKTVIIEKPIGVQEPPLSLL